jgi:hypothetical protein
MVLYEAFVELQLLQGGAASELTGRDTLGSNGALSSSPKSRQMSPSIYAVGLTEE